MPIRLLVLFAFCVALIVGAGPCFAQKPVLEDAALDDAFALPDLVVDEPGDDPLDSLDEPPSDDAARPVVVKSSDTEAQWKDFQVKVFRLRNIRSDQAAAMVRQVFSDHFLPGGLSMDADPQQNLLVMRGPADWLEEIEALLMKLDSTAAENSPAESVKRPNEFQPQPFSPFFGFQDENKSVENEFQHLIRQLAVRYQSLTDETSEGNDASGDGAREVASELRAVVEQAFDIRQQRQQQQVRQLEQRLATLQERVQEREGRRQRIIDQAVRDLLSTGKKDGHGRRQERLFDALGAIGDATRQESALNEAPSTTDDFLDEAATPEAAFQAALAAFEHAQLMRQAGFMSAAAFKTAEAELAAAQNQMAISQHEMAAVRAATETDIKRLELNLLEAEALLTFALEEYDEAERLKGKGYVSDSEFRKRTLGRRQAEVEFQRAKLELEAATKHRDVK